MKKYTSIVLMVASVGLLAARAEAKVVGEPVSYSADGVEMKGYLAYDAASKAVRPGVLVVHEWWGHNDYARKRARMLAEQGYTALAVDMFGNGKQADHPDQASQFVAEVTKNMPVAERRFLAALSVLSKHPTVDAKRIAAIGYCFGGGVVLHMARVGTPLRAVLSFHGALATPAPAPVGKVKAKIVAFTGADDPFVPAAQVAQFEQEMKAAAADARVVSYPGVKHSFTNPQADALARRFKLPMAYNKKADLASWAEALKVLKAAFGQ